MTPFKNKATLKLAEEVVGIRLVLNEHQYVPALGVRVMLVATV
jgi:hypothetical protein